MAGQLPTIVGFAVNQQQDTSTGGYAPGVNTISSGDDSTSIFGSSALVHHVFKIPAFQVGKDPFLVPAACCRMANTQKIRADPGVLRIIPKPGEVMFVACPPPPGLTR
jgi:hypothetical protein